MPVPAHPPAPGRVALVALLAGISCTLIPGCPNNDQPSATPRASVNGTRSQGLAKLPLQVDGGKVDLGEVLPCSEELQQVVKLRNVSDQPVEVVTYISNCSCVAATLHGSKTIEPGGVRDLGLTVYPTGSGNRSVCVEFVTKGAQAGSVRVDYRIREAVCPVPRIVDFSRSAHPEAIEFELAAADGSKDFKVLALDPPVGEIVTASGPRARVRFNPAEIEAYAATEAGRAHHGMLFSADGTLQAATISALTDDPLCPQVELSVSFAP